MGGGAYSEPIVCLQEVREVKGQEENKFLTALPAFALSPRYIILD